MSSLEALEMEALRLPEDQRMTLAHRIMASIKGDTDADTEKAWDKEIQERIKRFDSGKTKSIPAKTVFRELAQKLKK